jgi:hypothetical protein
MWRLRSLQTLEVSGTCFSNKCLCLLSDPQTGAEFRCLDAGLTSVVDQGLLALCERSRSTLIELNVSRAAVTDVGIANVGRLCEQLQLLDITHNEALSDVGMLVVASNIRSLKTLRASFCVLITDVTIQALARNAQQLYALHVRGCSLITDVSLQQVRVTFPLCAIFDF